MAHFSELDSNNIVLRVIVVDDAYEADGEKWCNSPFWRHVETDFLQL